MDECIRQLCALSIFFGAAVSLAPEGGVKKMMELACTAALALTLLLPLGGIDLESYALELAKYREREMELTTNGSEAAQRLNRLVIEDEYEAYILDKASELGMVVTADVELRWSTEGLWMPESASIAGCYTPEQKRKLTGIISAQLGIAEERQEWSADG